MKKSILRFLLALLLVATLVLPITALAAVDDSYTTSLLHMDGTNNSTTFIDESGRIWTSSGNAKIDTSISKFGGASGYFDGTNSYIATPYTSDFPNGTESFTIDYWIYIRSFGSGNVVMFYPRDSPDVFYVAYFNNAGTALSLYSTSMGGAFLTGTVSVSINTWYHIAFVRDGNIWYEFLNGSDVGNAFSSASMPAITTTFNIGGCVLSGEYSNISIDEFRITQGMARWTSNFTPPTSEYEPSSSTVTPSPSPTDTSAFTATPTFTSTPTLAPSSTSTLTLAPTSTLTPPASSTPTITPISSIAWAPSPFSITIALQNALASVLIAAPPTGSSGDVYGVINAQSDGSGGWYISMVNIVGVDSPYTNWDALSNGGWRGSMDCTGSEPTWTCAYYVPAPLPGGGDSTGLVFPWQQGTYAVYGPEGIHHDNLKFSGDDAVDFLGDDAWQSSMPPYMYAPVSGTVEWSCQGPHNGGIILKTPSGDEFMLFHLAPNQSAFTIGTVFQQGAEIGRLAYGTFNDTIAPYYCGDAHQAANEYHVHFAWMPSGTTFSMGGCILNLSSQNWVCGNTTIPPTGQGQIMNNGGSAPVPTPAGPTPTPGGPTSTPVVGGYTPVGGGEHVWNGIIQAVIDFINTNAGTLLGRHTPNPKLAFAVNQVWTTDMSIVWMVQALNMITIIPGLFIWGLILLIEGIRWVYVAYRYIVRLFPAP
jgi:Concanavalin A-like lectin/glucanases superfamily